MDNKSLSKPLGVILEQAGLVSTAQIQVALRDQILYTHLRLGEILALRGWVKQETIDFFVDKLPELLDSKIEQPIGEYLKQASLLNEDQIKIVLKKQKETGMLFGSLVVRLGWVKQTTIDFFVAKITENLNSKLEIEIEKWDNTPESKSPQKVELAVEGNLC
ncbi:MAG: hypothetical protein QNJ54_18685 [Prochloraceae cyanobacterium]|nr:hypothetical protein [Prochloraceae cyanobacterium]